tara:strand:+ start:15012 stop:15140 length:129 start_codon:yes stop_codon:yes gene_type:complete
MRLIEMARLSIAFRVDKGPGLITFDQISRKARKIVFWALRSF